MGRLIILILFISGSVNVLAATCTITTTANWSACTCNETGNAPVSGDDVVVNSGVTLTFTTQPSFTGTLTIYGTVVNDKANALWNGNITVKNGGLLSLNQQLDVGNTDGCGYTIAVDSGGTITLDASGGSDLLRICGKKIAQSGGGCFSYPTGPLPYCEPSGGFTGPFGFNQNGLPIELLYFNVSIPKNENHALIEWATADEENFDHFEIERASSDLVFSTMIEVEGAGYNTNSVKKYSAYDENPLVGTGYYRLKAVDIDGTYEYFKVKSVNYNGGRKLFVWSNPASGSSFKYSINFEPGPNDRVTLINQAGKELYSTSVTETENELTPDVRLKPGVYLLRYSSPDFKETARVFIKE